MVLKSAPLLWWPLLGIVGGTFLLCIYAFLILFFVNRTHKVVDEDVIGDDHYVDPPAYEKTILVNPNSEAMLKRMAEEEATPRRKKSEIPKATDDETDSDLETHSDTSTATAKKKKVKAPSEKLVPLTATEVVFPRSLNGTVLPFPSGLADAEGGDGLGMKTEETDVVVADDPNDMFRPLPYPPEHVGKPTFYRPPSSRYGNPLATNAGYGNPYLNTDVRYESERAEYSENAEEFYGVVNTGRPLLSGRTYHTAAGEEDANSAQQFMRTLSMRRY